MSHCNDLIKCKVREVRTTKHLVPCRAVSLRALSPAAVGDVPCIALASVSLFSMRGGTISSRDAGLAGFVDQDFAVVDKQLVVHGASRIPHFLLNERNLQKLSVQLVQKSAKREVARGLVALCLQTVELVLVGHDEIGRRSKVLPLELFPSLQLALKELGLVVQAQQPDGVEDLVGVSNVGCMCLDLELKSGIDLVKQPASNNDSPELPSVVVDICWVRSRKVNIHNCIEFERPQDVKDLIAPDRKTRLRLELRDIQKGRRRLLRQIRSLSARHWEGFRLGIMPAATTGVQKERHDSQ